MLKIKTLMGIGMVKMSFRAIASFILTFSLFALLISISILNKMNVEKLIMEQLLMEKSTKANETISRLLYKTQALASIVVHNDGKVENFEQIASTIIDDSAILNILIAPGGVVTNVYPVEGNEAVLGLDFFSESAGNKEAIQAKETGQLVFGGPFLSVQGAQILVGRLPVFIYGSDGAKVFWGLVSVTLKYPEALDGIGLDELQLHGYAYELWRVNPDDGQKQIIASSGYKYNKDVRYIEKHISIQNADWYLRILPVKAWYEYFDNWLLIILGLCISALVAYVMQKNSELKVLNSKFENLSNVDPLTGLYNRRFMEEKLTRAIKSISRSGGTLSVLMVDVDRFKEYNDTYGHNMGDACLKTVAETIANSITREDDFIARYGGEEFVVALPNTDENGARTVANRILENIRICCLTHEKSDVADHLTVSIGVTTGNAEYTHSGSDYIERADEALYMSKQSGRDRYTFLDYKTKRM